MTMTRGRRALLALLQRIPTRFVAATCSVTPRAVRLWASGEAVPAPAKRAALERYRIASDTWASTASTASTATRRPERK